MEQSILKYFEENPGMAQINHFCTVNRSEILAECSDILTGGYWLVVRKRGFMIRESVDRCLVRNFVNA